MLTKDLAHSAQFKEQTFSIRCYDPDTERFFNVPVEGYVSNDGLFGISQYEVFAGEKEPVKTGEFKVTHIPSGLLMGGNFVLLVMAVSFVFRISHLVDWKTKDLEALRRNEFLIKKIWNIEQTLSRARAQAVFLQAA
jgi:hypothetical protein